MKIKFSGSCCTKKRASLKHRIKNITDHLTDNTEAIALTDLQEAMAYGIMTYPAYSSINKTVTKGQFRSDNQLIE